MIKKILILIVSLLPVAGMKAQSTIGSWEVYANYLNPEKMLQTPSKVFILSAGSLYSFDKNTEEMYHYGIHNVLSETSVVNMFYNPQKDYIAVTYASGNIDIIKNDGKTINLPDIKDAVIQQQRTINDISFGKDRMYVATAFGIVVYDDKRWEVKESGIYNKNVKYVAATDKYICAYFSVERLYGIVPVDKSVRYYDNFVFPTFTLGGTGLRGLSDNMFLISTNNNMFVPALLIYDANRGTFTCKNDAKDGNYSGPYECKDGYYIYNTVASGNNIACIKQYDKNNNVTVTNLPSDFSGKVLAMWDNPNEVYVADSNGVSEYSFDDAGNLTMLHDSFKPEAVTSEGVGSLYSSDSGKIYVSSKAYDDRYGEFKDCRVVDISHIDVIENKSIRDITPSGLTYSGMGDQFKGGYIDGTGRPGHTFNIVEDPDDEDVYYIATLYDGVYKIKDGKELACYNASNSPLIPVLWLFYDIHGIDFDTKGNLWVSGSGRIFVLPSEKRKLNGTATKEDWIQIEFPYRSKDDQVWFSEFIVCKKNNILLLSIKYNDAIYAIDTNGTPTTSDDKTFCWESFIDQDGKEVLINIVYCFEEDKNGHIWVGTNVGLFVINDPKKLTDPSMRVQRVKVPRNDGTNFADYLLDGETISSIAVDGMNRKWITTFNSGVYLVSEDGSQILEHFTTENSYLPSNRIAVVECDKFSNAVYFGSIEGLVKYNADAAPAKDDYSEVYAYPNPVRPEYNGWITIAGLMEDSLVKIADASGNVFFQGTSNGGIITWDGCDASGERVKTGVYYVFASQNGDGTSSGAVTKILVVK